MASVFAARFDLLSGDCTNSISHDQPAHISRDHPATRLQVNSCECLQQECVHFPGRLVDNSTVSRDLPSSRWHPSTPTRVGDRISLKRLRARPAVHGSYLLRNLHQLSKPWSPPAAITTSKLSLSVRSDNTTKCCASISVDVSAPSPSSPARQELL